MEPEFFTRHPLLVFAVAVLIGIAIAWLVHRIGAAVLRRVTRKRPLASLVVSRAYVPSLWLLIAFALQVVLQGAPDTLPGLPLIEMVSRLALIGMLTWLAMRSCEGVADAIVMLNPADVADNLGARRIQTQTRVLGRCVNLMILVIGIAAMLLTLPGARQIGASIMASAGLMGLVAGFAAKPVLGNVIAGLQIALTQPIRIDDVLIVKGEWGRVEEITGAYVVIRIWDERRLVVPLQWFIENPFENWTRTTSQLIGTVFLWVDYRTPLDPLREELKRLCEATPEWDGRVCVLQVTDTNDRAMQIRALVSARGSGEAWDLRCKIREGLIAWVHENRPEYLPRLRVQEEDAEPKPAPEDQAVPASQKADEGAVDGGALGPLGPA
ncbi:Potassium efflux system KefA precursor [Bordetella ansorpii]|uniref:Potassium efflux system KefA n=1 Tax=Bordetella ansorpii TaxID=288768 RepID=A0A157PA33_9BORD|nr:mechanosensitive ion channel domain-containing protein [Bordetella ansorpii]SAI30403.1 Potassium efflux system KefA precursor [Bordetella ansorpii]